MEIIYPFEISYYFFKHSTKGYAIMKLRKHINFFLLLLKL